LDFKKLHLSIITLFGILMFGTAGYYLIEDMSVFEAFYMTVITISTVGFSEIKQLSAYGRVITIIVIGASMTIGAYSIGIIVKMFIEGELAAIFGRRKLEKQIAELKNHFIICGFGRIGRIICTELHADKIDFVVIEQEPAAIEALEKNKFLYLMMDATNEEALLKAGIMKSRGLVTAVSSDANNVFITLTAKGLRPDIFILSRASEPKNEEKMKKAGATRVVSPYLIGGRRMAQVLKRPTVVDFIDFATMDSSQLGLMIEEAMVRPGSNLVGKNLIESNLRKDFGVIIVAIKRHTGDMIFNPLPTEKLESGDVIVVLGKKEDMKRMNEIL